MVVAAYPKGDDLVVAQGPDGTFIWVSECTVTYRSYLGNATQTVVALGP